VIGRKNFREADRILILFTRDFGKITVLAKGVRKPISRKRGGIEIFNKIKFSATHSHGFDIMTEVEVLNSYEKVRNNLKKVSLAYYFCEVLGRLTRDQEKYFGAYEILDKYLNNLLTSNRLKQFRFDFLHEILVSLGFWPKDKRMDNPDAVLENIVERKINSSRVGRKMLQQ